VFFARKPLGVSWQLYAGPAQQTDLSPIAVITQADALPYFLMMTVFLTYLIASLILLGRGMLVRMYRSALIWRTGPVHMGRKA